MNSFELSLLAKLKKKIIDNKISAVVYRLKQSRYCSQVCDLLVDSPIKDFYIAIECKSRKDKNTLAFKGDFSESKRGGQLEAFEEFCNLSGRTGFLAFKTGRISRIALLDQIIKIKASDRKSTSILKDPCWLELKEFLSNLFQP